MKNNLQIVTLLFCIRTSKFGIGTGFSSFYEVLASIVLNLLLNLLENKVKQIHSCFVKSYILLAIDHDNLRQIKQYQSSKGQ